MGKSIRSGGRAMGKSAYIRELLANHPGKVAIMTATEVRQSHLETAAKFTDLVESLQDTFANHIAKSLDEVAAKTGINTVNQGRIFRDTYHAPRVMVPPLSLAEQAVMATFNICPQCNETVDYVHELSPATLSNTARGWGCVHCGDWLNQMQTEEQEFRQKAEREQMWRMQGLLNPSDGFMSKKMS